MPTLQKFGINFNSSIDRSFPFYMTPCSKIIESGKLEILFFENNTKFVWQDLHIDFEALLPYHSQLPRLAHL